jgi:hypothetical protein
VMSEVIENSREQTGPFPRADRVSASADGPQYELQSVLHTLDDLSPGGRVEPRPGGMLMPIVCTWIAIAALVGFLAWLFLSPPGST